MAEQTREYRVQGMTCAHCVAAVTEEVQQVAGVHDVIVDLDTGLLAVSGQEIDDQAIASAVVEAGYALA